MLPTDRQLSQYGQMKTVKRFMSRKCDIKSYCIIGSFFIMSKKEEV